MSLTDMFLCRVASEALRCYHYAKEQSRKVRSMREEERQGKAFGRTATEQRSWKALGSQDTTSPYEAAEE